MNHEIWWYGTSDCLEHFSGEVPRAGEEIMIITRDRHETELRVKDVRWRFLEYGQPMSAIVLVTLPNGAIRRDEVERDG